MKPAAKYETNGVPRRIFGHSSERGQSSLEYVVVCAALALALGIGMSNDTSALQQLLDAFKTAYQNFSYAISLPG